MKCIHSVQRDKDEGHAMTAVSEKPQTLESKIPQEDKKQLKCTFGSFPEEPHLFLMNFGLLLSKETVIIFLLS